MNLLDGIIIIIIVLGSLNGRRKGLVAMLGKLLGNIFAFVLALHFYQPFAKALNKWFNLSEKLKPILSKHLAISQEVSKTKINDIPFSGLTDIINGQHFPEAYIKILNGFLKTIQDMPLVHGINYLGEGLLQYMSGLIVDGIAFLLIYFCCGKLFKFLSRKTSNKLNITIFGTVNRMGGLLAGGVSSVVMIAIIVVVLAPLTTIALIGKDNGILAGLGQMISGSKIANEFINLAAKLIEYLQLNIHYLSSRI